MLIDDLEHEATALLPAGAARGAEALASAWAEGALVEVRCRVAADGGRRYTHRFDGVRLERAVLQHLLCPETACDHARAVRARWAAFRGELPAEAARPASLPLRVADLVQAVRVHAAGRVVEARPARFACLTPCPTGAHPPQPLQKTGWDVFEDGRCLAGGLQRDARSGGQRPRFEQVAEVAAWLRQRAGAAAPRP